MRSGSAALRAIAQATQAFQNTPGYQFQLQQGTQNVDRNQAAAGMLGSGNTDAAVSNYTTGLANQSWNQYLQNLQPYLGAAQGAAGGIGNLFSQLGQGINQNINTQGQAAYGTQAGALATRRLRPISPDSRPRAISLAR